MRVYLLHSNEPTLELLLSRLDGDIASGTRLPTPGDGAFAIVRWGVYHPDHGGETLQSVKATVLALQAQRAAALLRIHGIESALTSARGEMFAAAAPGAGTVESDRLSASDGANTQAAALRHKGRRTALASQRAAWHQEFIVPVFHLRALTVFHKSALVLYGERSASAFHSPPGATGDFREIGAEQPSYHTARAMREAVKAVYALGLDYAVVRVGVGRDGGMTITGVQPVPSLTPRLAELYAQALRRMADELRAEAAAAPAPGGVVLGADPEFLLRDARGKVIFASRYAAKEGAFGCDAIVLASRRKIFPLAELRPRPSADVRQLIINLHRTMQLAARQIADDGMAWIAGGMPVKGFPLGGHIHFSGVPLSGSLLRALDNYLALPLTLLEDATTGARKPKYGFLGDFRRQRHGGFEYRVLPSWIVSPAVAKGVLALAKLIAEHYRELLRRPLDAPEVQKAYYSGDKARIRPLLPALWRDLERTPAYAAYESYLLPLRRMMLQMKPWREQDDFRPKWKIAPFR